MKEMDNVLQRKTCEIKRHLPEYAKVVKTINGCPIYNINIFENIMSWNQENLDTPAFDYYGNCITYGELPQRVGEYENAFKSLGIGEGDVVTLCMPVCIENMMTLFALNCMGAISNSVNFLFLRSNLKAYTDEKKSQTLIILDAFLQMVIDQLPKTKIKNVVITSLADYLPESHKHIFDDMSGLPQSLREIFDNASERQTMLQEKIGALKHICFQGLQKLLFLNRGKSIAENKPINIERDVEYSYTSGTTGNPKCIVYKEESANAFIEMHAGLDTRDYVGERVFQIIPLTHATGERVSGFLPLAKGKTLVPQPIYDKESFAKRVSETKCNWLVAAPSFYLAAVEQGIIGNIAWESVTRPASGGEPVTKSNVIMIDEWLKQNGCKSRFAIGGGAAEDGSGTIFTYFMDEEKKTNETGYPLEPFIKAKIVDERGVCVKPGERGYLHISSPAAADRYLNDSKATEKRWYYEDGIRWGITGDIAVQNVDGSYNILGRADDSYLNEKGERIYLFDIENALEIDDPVMEWEITALQDEKKTHVVGQVVPKRGYENSVEDIVLLLCKKYSLDAVKFYEKFELSEVTGKRDWQKLKNDKIGYLAIDKDGIVYERSF